MKKVTVSKKGFTRKEALAVRDEIVWQKLSNITLADAATEFCKTFGKHTKRSYITAFNIFFQSGILQPAMSLQGFSLINLEGLLDLLKNSVKGSEATKQSRAAAFVAFTGYLNRKTSGMVRKVVPNREKANKTFQKIRDKSTTAAMNEQQWLSFIRILKETNFRDSLLAKLLLQGGKRLSEATNARIEQIDWQAKTISFRQLKSNILEKETVISYPETFLEELKTYLNGRNKGLIFLTKNGNQLTQQHVFRTFVSAGKKAGISFAITPHVLRASCVTWLTGKGFSSDQITKVTGHSDARMTCYYDRTALADNVSREVSLI